MAALKIRFWPQPKRESAPLAIPAIADVVGLDAFTSESELVPEPAVSALPSPVSAPGTRIGSRPRALIAIAAIIALAAGLGAYQYRVRLSAWLPSTGTVTFDTIPSGVEVFVRDASVGRSPVTVALAPGTYDVRLVQGAHARTFSVAVTRGVSLIQHYEMPTTTAQAPVATDGGLRIVTEPSGLMIAVDGVQKGVSPITLEKVGPGAHSIGVHSPQGLLERTVDVSSGETASVFFSSAAPRTDAGTVTAGWLTVRSRIPLQVTEGGRLMGTSDVEKLLLPSGNHDLEFSNAALGFRVATHLSIAAGKTTVAPVNVPNGQISVNALPWADVFIDGAPMGQTPIGNLSLPLGAHEIVFRHPELGERKETVNVTALAVARLGIDLRKR